jgi:hypothetical protein
VGEIAAFRRKFEQEHGVRLTFDNEATVALGERAEERGQSVLSLCEELFHDYQFGLKLIQRNTGRNSFSIPAEALDDPDKFLSNLVVSSYRDDSGEAGEATGGESFNLES